MKVCILGNGLTGLTLAKTLVNQGISVDIFPDEKIKQYDKIQTIGISKTNIDFFNKNILNIKKLLWNINKIEIYSENKKNRKILDFKNDNEKLFSIIRNLDLYNHLFKSLKKNKHVKFKKKIDLYNLKKPKYKLIFNCDYYNLVSKKFFYKKIDKVYNSSAYVTSFKHKKLLKNHTALQIFTKRGPLAFLPISSSETSVVYSIKGKKNLNLEDLISEYNTKYKIIKINNVFNFDLKFSNLRSYYQENIIAFGDLLHKLHPFAGQGFNMTIRDIKELHKLIQYKKEHGLDLDTSICSDFEKNVKNKNYLFSNGIDFIYEIFNLENQMNNNVVSKSIEFLGKKKIINKLFIKLADNGFVI
jgi:2-octaprenyl-6-methoxyphenol hydroxylase